MIKVTAAPAAIPAIETLVSEGININVTPVFSLEHYEDVAESYRTSLEKLAAQGRDVSRVASVASFFISRVDTAVSARTFAVNDGTLWPGCDADHSKHRYLYRTRGAHHPPVRIAGGSPHFARDAGATLGVLFIIVTAATLAEVIQ